MKIKIFLILIFVVCGLIIIYQKQQPEQIKPQRIIEEHQVTPVESLNIAVPKSLKINFKNQHLLFQNYYQRMRQKKLHRRIYGISKLFNSFISCFNKFYLLFTKNFPFGCILRFWISFKIIKWQKEINFGIIIIY